MNEWKEIYFVLWIQVHAFLKSRCQSIIKYKKKEKNDWMMK